MNSQKWSWVETATGTILFLFCLLVALTQFVNPFPHDGWFESQYRLFKRVPGADNYTPVAVPAFLYALIHSVAALFGRGLTAEFYLGSLSHHLLLFLTGVFLYLSHRCLGFIKSGLLASVLVVVFMESTLTPQAFWSENVTLFLMSAVLFIAILIVSTPKISDRSFLGLTLLLGLLLAGLIITRLIPFIILPGLIFLFWFHLPRGRAIHFALLATGSVLLVVLASMTANVYRYGRFELSNSMGRHLWNVVSLRSDEMLAGSREYQLLKYAIPDVQGKYWWDIAPNEIDGLKSLTREELFRTLSIDAIVRHPLTFAAIGVQNTAAMLGRCASRIGFSRAMHYNPLRRDTMLPALVHPLPLLEDFLATFHGLSAQIYGYTVYGTLLLGFSALAVGMAISTRSGKRNGALTRGVWLFLVFVFLTSLYLSCQIERPDSRYGVPYLPVLALIASIAIGLIDELIRKRGGETAEANLEEILETNKQSRSYGKRKPHGNKSDFKSSLRVPAC